MPRYKSRKWDYSSRPNSRDVKQGGGSTNLPPVKGASLANSETTSLFRRSARLEGIEVISLEDKEKRVVQQPSPTLSDTQQATPGYKRKRSQSYSSADEAKQDLDNSKPKTSHQTPESIELDTRYPVAYWASTQNWPPNFSRLDRNIMPESVNKRKSESTHTHRSDRLTRMQEHRIFMKASTLMEEASKNLCTELLQGDLAPISFPGFPAARVLDVLARVESENENRIQRDVMPIVAPAAENLRFCGVLGLESIVEELSAPWIRCATMGSTNPKPDYVVGLSQEAFSSDELEPLRNYATLRMPFLFTSNLCFPFLICEAKNGDESLNKAHRQNLHSAAIAVRAIHELHWAAYGKSDHRVEELYGKVLVFTIAHNHEMVHIYGHFAVVAADTPDTLAFNRFQIAVFSLTAFDGRDLNKPQNFVRNVYDKFVPQHLKRIKDAAKKLPPPEPRTSASLAASVLSLKDTLSQQDPQERQSQIDDCFQIPGEPASTMPSREAQMVQQIETLAQQMEQQRKEMEELKASLKS